MPAPATTAGSSAIPASATVGALADPLSTFHGDHKPVGLRDFIRLGVRGQPQRLIQVVRRTAGRSRKCGEVDDPAVTAAETPTSATGGQQRYSEVGGN